MSSFNILSAKFSRPQSSGFFLFSLLFFVVLAPILFLFPQNVYAVDVTLAWDANSEEDLAGYRVFCREDGGSYNYNDRAWEGDKTETSCTIYDLDDHTTYYFVVRAFDTSGNESGDSNEVCYQPNLPPTADAGTDQTVNEGVTVELDGSNSTDPDSIIESYLWTQTAGTSVTLSDPTAPQATFTAPSVGGGGEALTFQLEVTDDGGLKDTDTVIINVSNVNHAPVALAGPDQTVNEGDTVTLDGSNSYDPEGTIRSYSWTQTAGTSITLSDATAVQPTFIAPFVGVGGEALTFQLTVTDNGGLSHADTVIINVSNVNQAPTANAGPDRTVDEGDTVTLDGSNSSDPDGTIAAYTWTQTAGASVTLSDATAAQPIFTAPDVGSDGESLTFQLTVTDDGGLQSTDTCIVNVSWVDKPPVLSSVSITGASSVNENSTSNYTATATFSDGTTETVTESAIWSEDLEYASINNTGALSTSEVTWNETVTITATYSYGNVTKTALKVVTISDIPQSNLAPSKPFIYSPCNGETGLELKPVITTEPFSDPDGDTHSQSQWQISKDSNNFNDPDLAILDITSTDHLTELPVPHTMLQPETTYYVHVRFYDDYGEASDWSDTVEFTTTSNVNDSNPTNGIADDQEVSYDVDLNEDGIADIDQPTVIKCIQSSVGNATIGVCKISDSITAIEALETIDPATISDNTNRPSNLSFGLFSYRLSVNEPGATATVRVYFSEDISQAGTFFKYDTINGWQDYSQHTTFGEDGRSVILEVKDGGYGDSDGAANGFIVDPGGLAEASSSEVETTEGADSIGDGGSSSGGGCFIATAAFGSYAEPHVRLLRDFRDQRLLTNMSGRWFVRMYYRYGPFWADLINTHTWSKPIIRLALMPLVGISYVLIKACVVTRILAGLLVALFVLGCFLRMHRRPVTGGEQA